MWYLIKSNKVISFISLYDYDEIKINTIISFYVWFTTTLNSVTCMKQESQNDTYIRRLSWLLNEEILKITWINLKDEEKNEILLWTSF